MGCITRVLGIVSVALVWAAGWSFGQTRAGTGAATGEAKMDYRSIADEAEAMLRRDVLEAWFPRCIDRENGGFHQSFARNWTPQPDSGKFLVFQARMTWITATVATRRPELQQQYSQYARHGSEFLRRMWDDRYGGFYVNVANDGKLPEGDEGIKGTYASGFAVYALAAAYQATGDPNALTLARRGFDWIDTHLRDEQRGGYYEGATREGNRQVGGTTPMYGPVGYRTANSTIHMLEAYTQLYRVWRDERVRQRLVELVELVRDRVNVPPGCLNQWFTDDWRVVPDLDSYGHDVETAYLLLDAADVLGEPNEPRTQAAARLFVDHAMALGWNPQTGKIYNAGPALTRATDLSAQWWSQFEMVNALLLMHELHGSESRAYWDAFAQSWRFLQQNLIDHEFGGVFHSTDAQDQPVYRGKAQQWKAAYHDGRALLNISDRLRRMAGGAAAPQEPAQQ